MSSVDAVDAVFHLDRVAKPSTGPPFILEDGDDIPG